MPDKTNDNLLKDLNQLKGKLNEDAETLERLKQDYDFEVVPDLEKIEKNIWDAILQIDELRKKTDSVKAFAQDNRTFMKRLAKSSRPPLYPVRKIGEIRI
jgi:hypothetical protein